MVPGGVRTYVIVCISERSAQALLCAFVLRTTYPPSLSLRNGFDADWLHAVGRRGLARRAVSTSMAEGGASLARRAGAGAGRGLGHLARAHGLVGLEQRRGRPPSAVSFRGPAAAAARQHLGRR